MSIVAHVHPYVVGVDTHARHHVYSIVQAKTGELLESQKFPTTEAGINRAITWVLKRTDSQMQTLWVIEASASYGAILTGKILPMVLRLPRRLVLILSIVTVWVRLTIGILSRWLEQLWVYRLISYVDHVREAVFAKPSKYSCSVTRADGT